MGLDSGSPAVGWYDDPTGRHELRWFSQGTPTELVRDAAAESKDELSVREQALPAVSGPGLRLPSPPGQGDGRGGPVAWWDTGIPLPGEPTIADIGMSGYQGYRMIRQSRWQNRMAQRSSRLWLTMVIGMALFLATATLIMVR